MATAMANVRMDRTLKDSGDAVLKREGMNFTRAVNALYKYMVKEQRIPDCLLEEEEPDALVAKRRAALRGFVGCVGENGKKANINLDDLKAERLARQ